MFSGTCTDQTVIAIGYVDGTLCDIGEGSALARCVEAVQRQPVRQRSFMRPLLLDGLQINVNLHIQIAGFMLAMFWSRDCGFTRHQSPLLVGRCDYRLVVAYAMIGRFPNSSGEHKANMLGSLAVARRPDPEKPDVLNEEELKQLRHNLAHLSPVGVREFYERAFEDCRLVYDRLPSARKIQTLVQVWKQLWKWR